MTERELTAKLTTLVESQRSNWEKQGDKMVFIQENFKIKNVPRSVFKSNPVSL